MWLGWRNNIGKGYWLQEGALERELVERLTAFMTYCCTLRGNKEETTMGNVQAVNFYPDQWMGLLLPLDHFRVKAARQGIMRPTRRLVTSTNRGG